MDRCEQNATCEVATSDTSAASRGVLLVGHGTRDPKGTEEFLATARQVAAERPELPMETAFLEIAQPTIATGIERLAARGVRDVAVVPLLLFAAGHAKSDIPNTVRQAAASHRGMTWRQTPALECHPAILELSARRFREALDSQHSPIAEETVLIMVGRGSNDPQATAEMHRFVGLRTAMTPVGHVETCFVAMAEPRLENALRIASRLRPSWVVVQPHLLFDGLLMAEIRQAVELARHVYPSKRWLVTSHLGCDRLLVQAVSGGIDRCWHLPNRPIREAPADVHH